MTPKFRAWHKILKIMRPVQRIEWICESQDQIDTVRLWGSGNFAASEVELMQWTGLQDKSSLYEIYEGDIIDEYGNLAGNIYEDSGLYAQETYWAVTPICCQTWPDTYAELIKRGCHYAK